MRVNTTTWVALGTACTTIVGATWYLNTAIAEEGRRAYRAARAIVAEERKLSTAVYARRDDVVELKVKLDHIIKLLEEQRAADRDRSALRR